MFLREYFYQNIASEKMAWKHYFGPYKTEPRIPEETIILKHNDGWSFPKDEEELRWLRKNVRIVWTDGVETSHWQYRECPYWGVRVAHNLIICAHVLKKTRTIDVLPDKTRLLTVDELKMLDLVWEQVNALRAEVGDDPLPVSVLYWVQKAGKATMCSRQGKILDWFDNRAEVPLILATEW